MIRVELEESVAAPRGVVFDVLTDHERYAELMPLRSARLEREGDEERNGAGAIRALDPAPLLPPLREVVIVHERPSRFVYELISGAPLRDYRGEVELAEAGEGGTALRYVIECRPPLPLADGVVAAILRQVAHTIIRGVRREARRRALA